MKRKFLCIIMLLFMAFMLNPNEVLAVKSGGKISKSKIIMIKGKTTSIKVKGTKIKKISVTNKKVKVTNKKTKIKLKAKKVGKSTITVFCKNGRKYKCKVKIENPTLNRKSIKLRVGATKQLRLKKNTQRVKWSSSKRRIASVSSRGKIKARSKGVAYITAKVPGKKVKCKVTVSAKKKSKYYTVKFETNGGNAIAPVKVKLGGKVSKPTSPKKKGYKLVNWYSDQLMNKKYDFNSIVTQDMVLYALWGTDFVDNNKNGIPDCIENNAVTTDSDKDGLSDYQEITLVSTNPMLSDTDADGLLDSLDDEDQDSVNNMTEIDNGTNPLVDDSDNDGLKDGEEIAYKTNPTKVDTDGDDASDRWEIENKFNPLIYEDDFHIKLEKKSDDITAMVELFGEGDVVSSVTISEVENDAFINENIPGYIGSVYEFDADNPIDSAVISFKFDEKLLDTENFIPRIYYYNEETQNLEELQTNVNDNIASATVRHFSKYVLLNKMAFDTVWETDIRKPNDVIENNRGISLSFVLDRSNSMTWNDEDNLRNTLTRQFINKLSTEKDYGSVISFIAKAEVLTELTNDKTALINAVDSIVDDDGWGDDSGTNGSAGIYEALQQLKEDKNNNAKYIIFMTDGEDTTTSYSYSTLIDIAKENGVTIYTVGLGEVDDSILTRLATETGGKYYYASDANEMIQAFINAENETIDYHTDSNNDGISDYYTKLLCEGKLVAGTGVSLFQRCSYENVQKNADYDGDGIRNGKEITVIERNGKVYLNVFSSPTSVDTDQDGINDNQDTEPMKKGLKGGIIGELTIVSCHPNDAGFTGGHAWLTYKSYVNDMINVSGLLDGYIYDSNHKPGDIPFIESKIPNYKINRNGYIAIGNAGTEGTSGALSHIAGSCGGILYNREFYGASADSYFYVDVAAHTKKITEDQLKKLLKYCTDNCYYNLYSHNCSSVASEGWEAAFGTSEGLEAKKSGIANGVYSLFDTPATLKENILLKSDADKDYRSTMLKIIENWK